MNSSTSRKSNSDKTESAVADPFAADIFANRKKEGNAEPEIETLIETREKTAWARRLPKTARRQTNWTNLLQNLSVDFSENLPRLLAESLTDILNSNDENLINFAFVENRETIEKNENCENEASDSSWQILIGIEPSAAKLTIEIEDVFAVWLIDRILGESIAESSRLRDLTRTEIAVLEYILVNLLYEANSIVNAPLLKFVSLSRKRVRPITKDDAENSNEVLVSMWQAIYNTRRSLLKINLSAESLEALQRAERNFSDEQRLQSKTRRAVENRVKDFRMRLLLGKTPMTLADAAGIETGDVILIERYDFKFNRDEFFGSGEVFLGDGEELRIVGSIESLEFESPSEWSETSRIETTQTFIRRVRANQNLRFSILYFEQPTDANFTEKSMNEDFDNLSDQAVDDFEDESDGGGIALENLAVTLRVELEARRLSLAEVGNLRVNQIIELGARATDPVNLIINDKTIARGELVEVEDRLGVRIIQILR